MLERAELPYRALHGCSLVPFAVLVHAETPRATLPGHRRIAIFRSDNDVATYASQLVGPRGYGRINRGPGPRTDLPFVRQSTDRCFQLFLTASPRSSWYSSFLTGFQLDFLAAPLMGHVTGDCEVKWRRFWGLWVFSGEVGWIYGFWSCDFCVDMEEKDLEWLGCDNIGQLYALNVWLVWIQRW